MKKRAQVGAFSFAFTGGILKAVGEIGIGRAAGMHDQLDIAAATGDRRHQGARRVREPLLNQGEVLSLPIDDYAARESPQMMLHDGREIGA